MLTKNFSNLCERIGFYFGLMMFMALSFDFIYGNEHGNENCSKSDVDSLQKALKSDPTNPDYLFQLAQSYKGLSRYHDAIRFYEERIANEVDSEEIWFSKLMIGECYESLDMWEHALYWYLEAYQYNRSRPEPFQKLSKYYRLHGENDLAYLFAKHGSQITYPYDAVFMSDPPLQNYQFDEELSIAAYYTDHKEDGLVAVNALVLRKNVPWFVRNQAYQNMQFYVRPLEGTRFESIEVETPRIPGAWYEYFCPTNPSICKTEDGYKLICRTVNYIQGILQTKSFLIEYDKNFNILSQHEIVESSPRERYHFYNAEGLEDCRIIEFDQDYWFSCTIADTNPLHRFQVSLCKLANQTKDKTIPLEKLIPLKGPDPDRHEKNWLPLIYNHQLCLIYSYDPFIIYKPDFESGQCETVFEYMPKHDFSNFRGSAAPIKFDDGYLMVVHEVTGLSSNDRRYMRRFLYLNKDFEIEKLSLPFIFLHLGIEFCGGMTIDHSGKQLVLSIGVRDEEAYLCFLDLDRVRSLLNPLPSY